MEAALVQLPHLQTVRDAVEARKRTNLATTGGELAEETVPATSASLPEHLPLPPSHPETEALQGQVGATLPGGTLPGGTAHVAPDGVPGGSLGVVPDAVAGSSEASRYAAAAWFDPDTRFRTPPALPLPLFYNTDEVFGYGPSTKQFFGTCLLLFGAAVLTLVLSHLFTLLIGRVRGGKEACLRATCVYTCIFTHSMCVYVSS